MWREVRHVSLRFKHPSNFWVPGAAVKARRGVSVASFASLPLPPPNRLIPISSVIGMQPQSGGGRGIFGKERQSSWELYSD